MVWPAGAWDRAVSRRGCVASCRFVWLFVVSVFDNALREHVCGFGADEQ